MEFKIFFSRTSVLNSTKLGTKLFWMKGTSVFTKKGPFNSQKGDKKFLNVIVHSFAVSQVSNVVHWSIVF